MRAARPARHADGAGCAAFSRAVAALAPVVGAAARTWRAPATGDLAVRSVSIPLLLLEWHAFVGLCLCTVSRRDIDARHPARRAAAPPLSQRAGGK
ncbi:MAG TPA: hypothetical protein VFW96_05145 [Thermomicrobiales bacterium]|nr:hypothetical protein [Thermomicrobiales bacterium]